MFGFIGRRQIFAKCHRSIELVLASALLSLLLAACAPEEGTVPVSGRFGYEPSRSVKLVRNDLYNYVDNNTGDTQYLVEPEPPLSFEFPDAFYMYNVNHKAGPVPVVGLLIDKKTWGPFPLSFEKFDYTHTMSDEDKEDLSRRLLMVTIYSDFLSGHNWELRDIPDVYFRRKKNLYEIGEYNGFLFFSYEAASDLSLKRLPPVIFGGIDFTGHQSIFAYPSKDPTRRRYIECKKIALCNYKFSYFDREVNFIFDRFDLPNVRKIEERLIKLLDEHRIT